MYYKQRVLVVLQYFIKLLDSYVDHFYRHRATVLCIALHGNHLASGSRDKSVKGTGRAIPFSFLYHVTMTTSNIMCLRLINLFRFVGYIYVDCRVLKENTK